MVYITQTLVSEIGPDYQLVCRCEMKTFVSPEAISSDLVRKIRDLHRKILTLPEMMSTFSGKGEGAAAFLVPLVVQFSIHLYLSAPSKPGSRHLPSLSLPLAVPLCQGDLS